MHVNRVMPIGRAEYQYAKAKDSFSRQHVYTAVRARAALPHSGSAWRLTITMSRFMHFWVDILIVLYIFGFGTARLGEWRLNHIHSINGAEVISASCLDSSAEIDY